MIALVLTAGLGTRLRPLTYVRAKAAVPVNGEALVRRALRWLARQGIHHVVLNLHHQPASIAAAVGDGADLGLHVRYSWEQPVLGSAGGPRHALPLLTDRARGGSDTFLVVNGDTLTDLDLETIVRAHRSSGALVTMALIPNPHPEKYGGVVLDGDSAGGSAVRGFTRPSPGTPSYHFIGVQVAEARAFDTLADGVPAESVNALYPALIRERAGTIRGFVCDAPFQDIGTPADYLATSLAFARSEESRLVSASASVHAHSVVLRTALWDDVVVGPDAQLIDCVVGDGARIPAGARFTRKAIVPAHGRQAREDETIVGDLLIRDI
jgi:NDP-sugar pyrophosphorylase family protein